MKKVVTTSIVLLSTLALTACSTNNINKKISKDKATSIALKDAKLNKKMYQTYK